jgi:hypothetical protein
MSAAELRRIRGAVESGNYDLTLHAAEELAEDDLDIVDLETAVENGELLRSQTDDRRGERYTIAGPSADGGRRVGLVGRFTETGVFLVITAFEARPRED